MSEESLNSPVPEWFSRLFSLTRIRIAAEKKIVDEKRYFDVMTADPIEEVRRRAVCRLTDQALLRQAAERDPKETVRAEAAKRLTDQEYLFHMLFSDPSDDVRIAASIALTDDDLCFRTAMSHPIPAVCVNAMKQIGDQQLLARILTESEDRELRRETALAITDPAVAKELVQGMPSDHEDFPTPRVFLISAIDDQDMLTELALNDPDYKARRAAAARVTAPEVLMRIIRDETEYDVVRAAAAGQIRDQETLRDLADTYYHKLAPYDIGEEALKHIEDQAYLKSVAEDYCLMHCLREAAATHVTDQEILFDWAMNANYDILHDIGLAGIAVRQLTVPEYLARTAAARVDEADLSERAIERLHDDQWLLWVMAELGKREDALDDYWIRSLRCAAAGNVGNAALLVEPALNECNDEYDILESMELECIRSIAEDPSAMHEYASRMTNPDAWVYAEDLTLNCYGLEGFLENPKVTESERETVLKKINRLNRLNEIGMADEQHRKNAG